MNGAIDQFFKYDDDAPGSRMTTDERPGDFHPQDWIIDIEALAQWAGVPDGSISRRRERAYELIEAIAVEEGLPADELLRQAVASCPRC